MSDSKPKRTPREPARSENSVTDVVAAATAPVVEANIPEAESVSSVALAQAVQALPMSPVPSAPEIPASGKSPDAPAEDAWLAFSEAQSALARGFENAAVEVTGISRSGMAATAEAAMALLGARTFAEAVEINAGLARRSVDAMFEGSARLTEIGANAVADASRPLLARFGWRWSLPRVG